MWSHFILHRSQGEEESGSAVGDCESDAPVFEVPPEKYSAEDTVRILLNPNIDLIITRRSARSGHVVFHKRLICC